MPRRIDLAGEGKYPDIVSGKDLNRISDKEGKEEESTEMPEIESEVNSDLEMSEVARDDIEETAVLENISALEMENFELSDETFDFSEPQETTIEPFEDDLEITTITN